jgi:type VI secretion system protein
MLAFFTIFSRCMSRYFAAFGLICTFWLVGCSSVGSAWSSLVTPTPRPITPVWQSLVISASPDANLNSPVAVDILFISTAELQKNFQDLTAVKWFAGRENAMRTFPDGLKLISLELVPGQTIHIGKVELSRLSALQAVVFANYSTPGDHKSVMAMDETGYVIKLESRAFKASAVSGQSKP